MLTRPSVNLRARAAALLGLFVFSSSACSSCLERQPRPSVSVLPYPTCPGTGDAAVPGEVVLAENVLRAGPVHSTPDLVERYRIVRRGCHIVATVRQAWSRQVDDVEVVYDSAYRPIRAWKRMSIPDPRGQSPLVDVRRYEFRTMPVSMTARTPNGLLHYEMKRHERPIAVIGPGRGLIAAWIAMQPLRVDESVRGPVFDFRASMERIDTVALRREADRQVEGMGRVRVYTVFGRESVFADDHGTIVGDLAGLRPASTIVGPIPALAADGEPIDPANTP